MSDIDNGFKLSIGIRGRLQIEIVLERHFRWIHSGGINKFYVFSCCGADLLKGFIEFRSECIINKTRVRIEALDKQIERLSGIIAVLVDIDKAIKIIRGSKDDKVAKDKLQKTFKINEEQSEYILSMPLRRLTKSDSLSIKQQIKDLKEEHRYLSKLLKDDKVFNEYMIEELKETKKIIDDPRRTTINTMTEEEMKGSC